MDVAATPSAQDYDYERYNLALAKEGAKVVAAHPEAKKPQAVLDHDGDTFMKSDCGVDKWVIVELSQVAKMDTIDLTQNEPYTSLVKEFEVLGRATHPRQDLKEGTGPPGDYGRTFGSASWKHLGRFTAEKRRGCQSFHIAQPHWVRYVAVRFLNQHTNERICAVSSLAVYGKTATQDLEEQLSETHVGGSSQQWRSQAYGTEQASKNSKANTQHAEAGAPPSTMPDQGIAIPGSKAKQQDVPSSVSQREDSAVHRRNGHQPEESAGLSLPDASKKTASRQELLAELSAHVNAPPPEAPPSITHSSISSDPANPAVSALGLLRKLTIPPKPDLLTQTQPPSTDVAPTPAGTPSSGGAASSGSLSASEGAASVGAIRLPQASSVPRDPAQTPQRMTGGAEDGSAAGASAAAGPVETPGKAPSAQGYSQGATPEPWLPSGGSKGPASIYDRLIQQLKESKVVQQKLQAAHEEAQAAANSRLQALEETNGALQQQILALTQTLHTSSGTQRALLERVAAMEAELTSRIAVAAPAAVVWSSGWQLAMQFAFAALVGSFAALVSQLMTVRLVKSTLLFLSALAAAVVWLGRHQGLLLLSQ